MTRLKYNSTDHTAVEGLLGAWTFSLVHSLLQKAEVAYGSR